MAFRYYESLLSSAERDVYRAFSRGLLSYEKQFSAPRVQTDRLGEIFTMVKLDDPMIFGVERLSFKYFDGSSSVTVTPVYTMKKQERQTALETVKKRVKKILAPAADLDPYEKELFIHDYIVNNVRYDRLTKSYSHEVTGPLCHGIGVCEGMAKTFKLLCDEAGIDSLVATGVGVPPDAATGKKSERHAWNIVYMDGEPLGVDVTFDNTLSGDGVRYDYFNVPDVIMSRDHSSPDFPLPKCVSEGKDFYSLQGMTFRDVADASRALKRAAKPPHRVSFRLVNVPEENGLKEAVSSFIKGDRAFSRFSSFSYGVNKMSGVVTLTFTPR